MDKKKIAISAVVCIVVLVIGITIGIFIGKDTNEDVSADITTSEEVGDTTTEQEKVTQEEVTEEITEKKTTETTTEEPTTEATTKAVKYTQVDEVVYATANVNIRAGAGTSAKIISALKKGDSIKRTAIGDNGWSKVSYNGKTAYVFSTYLTKNSPGSGNADMCGISNTDAKNLTDLLEYIIGYGMEEYDYKDNDAFEMAFATIHALPYYNFSELVSEIYRIHYDGMVNFPYENEGLEADPRGYWQQFRYVEAEYIDFILEDMFNVKPDHSYVMHSEYWCAGGVYAYYQDGYYYSDAGDGGDGCGPEIKLKKVERLSDGKYQVTVNYRVVEAGGVVLSDFGNYNVIAEIKNIDGNSIWSFYKIEKA